MHGLTADARDWFLGLGESYGVDPLIFGVIYVGAIPFFLLSVAWLVRRLRGGRSITLPLLSAGFFFVSAYLYVAIVGHDIPTWVWAVFGLLIAYGAVSTVKSARERAGDRRPRQ